MLIPPFYESTDMLMASCIKKSLRVGNLSRVSGWQNRPVDTISNNNGNELKQ